ncbi:MAG: alpha/beta fold hydrolase [Clostridiales bacterium]|nr:alpha/beta fold hydrolase [Clostridiales bacterium]
MKKRKILKTVLVSLLSLVVLCGAVLGGLVINNRVKLNKAKERLDARGLYNPVSVGDHNLNVVVAGNTNGEHKIVTLTGWSDGTESVSWDIFTDQVRKDNEMIYIDRAGYGLSDDVDVDVYTAERTVDEYRTALKNAGIEAPYVLLAHSIGGVYTTYWVEHYPEEIEGVFIMDGSYPSDVSELLDSIDAESIIRMQYLYNNSGLARYTDSQYAEFYDKLPREDGELARELMIKTSSSKNAKKELIAFANDSLANEAFGNIKGTDIPKVYLCSSSAYETKEELAEDNFDMDIHDFIPDSQLKAIMERTGLTEDDYYDLVLEYFKDERNDYIVPYVESLGNSKVVYLHGEHEIFVDKPQETQELLLDFLEELGE